LSFYTHHHHSLDFVGLALELNEERAGPLAAWFPLRHPDDLGGDALREVVGQRDLGTGQVATLGIP